KEPPDPALAVSWKKALNAYLSNHNREDLIKKDVLKSNDPDADRFGYVIRVSSQEIPEDEELAETMGIVFKLTKEEQARYNFGGFRVIPPNEWNSLIEYYDLNWLKKQGKLDINKHVAVYTHVTSSLMQKIADYFGIKTIVMPVGIDQVAAEIVRQEALGKQVIIGSEESGTYTTGNHIHDKDGFLAGVRMAEIACFARAQGKTVNDLLNEIYLNSKIGFFATTNIPIEYEVSVPGIAAKLDAVRFLQQELEPNVERKIKSGNNPVISGYRIYDVDEQLPYRSGKYDKALDYPNYPDAGIRFYFNQDKTSFITDRPSGTGPQLRFYNQLSYETKSLQGNVSLLNEMKKDAYAECLKVTKEWMRITENKDISVSSPVSYYKIDRNYFDMVKFQYNDDSLNADNIQRRFKLMGRMFLYEKGFFIAETGTKLIDLSDRGRQNVTELAKSGANAKREGNMEITATFSEKATDQLIEQIFQVAQDVFADLTVEITQEQVEKLPSFIKMMEIINEIEGTSKNNSEIEKLVNMKDISATLSDFKELLPEMDNSNIKIIVVSGSDRDLLPAYFLQAIMDKRPSGLSLAEADNKLYRVYTSGINEIREDTSNMLLGKRAKDKGGEYTAENCLFLSSDQKKLDTAKKNGWKALFLFANNSSVKNASAVVDILNNTENNISSPLNFDKKLDNLIQKIKDEDDLVLSVSLDVALFSNAGAVFDGIDISNSNATIKKMHFAMKKEDVTANDGLELVLEFSLFANDGAITSPDFDGYEIFKKVKYDEATLPLILKEGLAKKRSIIKKLKNLGLFTKSTVSSPVEKNVVTWGSVITLLDNLPGASQKVRTFAGILNKALKETNRQMRGHKLSAKEFVGITSAVMSFIEGGVYEKEGLSSKDATMLSNFVVFFAGKTGNADFLNGVKLLCQDQNVVSSPASAKNMDKGGIDFRALPMTIQPMGSFQKLTFSLPAASSLAQINISKELVEISQMV
ncbi:MAG: hypothetical protein WCY05_07740, partial [Candidatus Omnitrophota bacterium]